MGGLGDSGEVVSIARAAHGSGYKHLASGYVAAARVKLGMSHTGFADHLTARLGWRITPEIAERWEQGSTPPADVGFACQDITDGMPGDHFSLLEPVPSGFPAAALAGPWVTAYQFSHAGMARFHADIAHVTAEGERQVRVVNHPPEPRTQGRSSPFRNEIEGRLFGRHLIGTWRNTSDTRYYGTLQLAVLPGETVMDGHYTGLASDIEVSAHHWRWVRLEPGELAGLTLRDPSGLYDLVMNRTQDDPPLTLADIREDA